MPIATPAANAARVQRLPDLHCACRRDGARVALEVEARLVPGQATVREQSLGLDSLVRDQRLVPDFVHAARQHGLPVCNEPVELRVVPADIAQVTRVVVVRNRAANSWRKLLSPVSSG